MIPVSKVCVIGHPIAHSRSPLIHNHWLEKFNIRGSYEILDVDPNALADFFERLRNDETILGCNITIPHKQNALSHLDQLTATARQIGAVNTVFKQNGQLIGDNTDAYGFLANLDQFAPEWQQLAGEIALIGAGGATRALIHGLQSRTQNHIRIFNRTLSSAQQLAADFPGNISAHALQEIPEYLPKITLLINATALGMKGETIPHLTLDLLPENALVSDIVYTPLITPLLRAAKARNLTIVDGLGMLLHQAVPGFHAWFGTRPHVDDPLRQLVLADLEAH